MNIFKEMQEYPVACPMAEDYDGEFVAEPAKAPEAFAGRVAVTNQAESQSEVMPEPRTAAFSCAMDSMFDNAEY